MATDTSNDTIENDLEQPLLASREEDNTTEASSRSVSSSSPSTPTELPSISRLIMLGKPEFCILALAGLLMTFSQVSQLGIPLLVGRAYDDLVDPDLVDNKMDSINRLMFWALIIHLAGAVASGFRSTLMGIAGERIVARMRTTLYASILQQEIAFFDATKSGELVSRLGSDTMVVKRAIASSWAEVVLGLIRLVATLALMFLISPKLAGLTVGSTFGVFIVCLPFGRKMGKLSKAYQEVLGEAQNFPTEVIGAMRTVKSFGAETREAGRYSEKIGVPSYCPSRGESSTFRIGYDQSLVRACFSFCIFGGGFGAMYGTLWYGFYLVNQNELRIGDLSAFQAYILGIGGILAHMSSSISNLIEARHASQRIFSLLDREPKISDNNNAAVDVGTLTLDDSDDHNNGENGEGSPKIKLDGKISFNGVSFSYPTRSNVPVLQNFTLNIPKEKTTAIVGPSGAGKSTIISLLERFYDVDGGSICVDGVDIRQMGLNQLRKQLGYVQQEPTLFGLSVRDNLCYGLEDATSISDEELMEACRTANAYDFVSRLPNGLDEMVGERGVTLSGGQKQRLAIARAILGSPSVLLLDEATSALDAESEFLVQQAMDAASKGRTVVVVAHRLSTIKKADQIVVMENHTLKDAGTHNELMKRCETYKNLISKQSFVHHPDSPIRNNRKLAKVAVTSTTSKTATKTPNRRPKSSNISSSNSSALKSPVPSNAARRQQLVRANKTTKADPSSPSRSELAAKRHAERLRSANKSNNNNTKSDKEPPSSITTSTPRKSSPFRDEVAAQEHEERLRKWKESKKNKSPANGSTASKKSSSIATPSPPKSSPIRDEAATQEHEERFRKWKESKKNESPESKKNETP